MRTLTGFVGLCAVAALLIVGAVVALAIQLLPYVILGVVIGLVVQRGRQPRCRPAGGRMCRRGSGHRRGGRRDQ
jgi:hypothetical protein